MATHAHPFEEGVPFEDDEGSESRHQRAIFAALDAVPDAALEHLRREVESQE